MNKIVATMTQQENALTNVKQEPADYSSLWAPKVFEEDKFWFIKVDEGFDALSMDSLVIEPASKEEKCVVEVPSIAIIIENGIGVHTIPMLFIETSMDAQICNWSSDMGITSTMRLTMSYYNNMLALWEPLIEPVEMDTVSGLSEYNPWELMFELNVDKHLDDPEKDEPTTYIKIKSEQTLELLVTKTCLDVLQTLGNAFSKAIEQEGLIKTGVVDAPYVLRNDTGLEIQLELSGTEFLFHAANFTVKDENCGLVVFENTGVANSPVIENITSCVLYSGGKVYLQPKTEALESFSLLDETIKSMNHGEKVGQEKFISLYIPEVQKRLQLPIHRADKRYFPIYRETNQECWGIISEISIEMGSTFVTIRGILQVFNHFTVPIKINRYVNGAPCEVGLVQPNESFNVPLNCIHDSAKDLHFSIAGYRTSTQGMSWKESPGNTNLVKSLQCDPINTYEPLYINAIRERFDVFFEISSKYTILSACYIIRLRPPLLLRNALPIDLVVSVAGCSVSRDRERNFREQSMDEDMVSAHQVNTTGIEGEDFLDYGEKLVKPGELLHLPTVKTAAKNSDNLMYIVARVRTKIIASSVRHN
jgi:vacuolar protein sorting-associated protein 13A/C